MLETALLIVMVVVALAVIGLILIQQGKGADIGASFGSGASHTVFGSQGSGNFLTKATSGLAAVFFVCCLGLAWYANHKNDRAGTIDFTESEVELKEVPAALDVPSVTPAPSSASDVPAPAGAETKAPSAPPDSKPAEPSTGEQPKPVEPKTVEQSAAPAEEPAALNVPVGTEEQPTAAPSAEQKTQ